MASVLPASDEKQRRTDRLHERDDPTVSADQLVELLGDEYTRQVLETIADEPMGGREIAEATSISRPTVYRRLNRLQELGLVETSMMLCTDGNHHKQFRAVLETANLQLDGSGLTASVQTEGSTAGYRGG